MTDRQRFYQKLKNILEREPVVLATIVEVIGSAPREEGAKMAILADGSIIGTIGGGAGEAKVIERALTVLETAEKQLVEIDLTGAPGKDVRGICGGKMRVWLEKWTDRAIPSIAQILELFESGRSAKLITPFTKDHRPYLISDRDFARERHFFREIESLPHLQFIESIQPPPTLLIIGGGHIALALAQIASFVGFQVAVQDDRPEFVTSQRFPQAFYLSQSIAAVLDKLASHSQLYVALVTRGLTQDIAALQTLVQYSLDYKYIGAIGSQKRIHRICQTLEQQGISLAKLPNFYAPIGLDIGALTPEEIAVSICGELILVRRGGTGLSLARRMQHSKSSAKVHGGERLYARSR